MPKEFKLLLDGKWQTRSSLRTIRHPLDQSVVGKVPESAPGDVALAVLSAQAGRAAIAALPAHERSSKLSRVAQLLSLRDKEFAKVISAESGKILRDALREVGRTALTFQIAAEAAKQLYGETIPSDAVPNGENRLAFTFREPLGVIGAITPFNFPLYLVAQKIAPALASGNAVVLKPSSQTPMSSLKLAELLVEVGFPPQVLNILFGEGNLIGEALVSHPDLQMISFTGSTKVGKKITQLSGIKKITLELGGNAAVVIEPDTPLERVIPRCVQGAFGNAGQTCISVQRIYVHQDCFESFQAALVKATQTLRLGNPLQETTDIGPMISEVAAQRAEMWIQEAVRDNAQCLCGGKRNGSLLEPTILTQVTDEMKVVTEEVFAPIVSLIPYHSLENAIDQVNQSRYGLQAGIYTTNLQRAFQAAKSLAVGGVMINEIPTWRADHMPYGGVKASGMGREGVRYAIEEMTNPKLVVINLNEPPTAA